MREWPNTENKEVQSYKFKILIYSSYFLYLLYPLLLSIYIEYTSNPKI